MPQYSKVSPGGFNNSETDIGLKALANIERVGMIDDNTCGEKCKQCCCPCLRTCCCPRRFKVTNAEKGYKLGDQTLYKVVEAKCCWPCSWNLVGNDGSKVNRYSAKCCVFPCFQTCCGGPGFDVHDFQTGEIGKRHGYAKVPCCQCFDSGFDVMNDNEERKWFVGNVCHCCHDMLIPSPVWNDDKSEIVKMNMFVTPCLKRYLPCFCCCLRSYWIVDFPMQATGAERSEMVAGTLMKAI